MNRTSQSVDQQKPDQTMLVTRSLFGGLLMGLANLVPGISGGTMLLAAGIYPDFIEALADLTRCRFRFRALLVLNCVAVAAAMGILLFAGSLKDAVLDHRWIMYSLFIGLTLGGVPIVWRLARPASTSMTVAALIAFVLMASLVGLQVSGIVGSGHSNYATLFFAGLAGASAMILPGLSGGYLLLLMGQYVPILSAVDQFKEALKDRDLSAAMEPAVSTLIPVGVGVIAGIVLVGNMLKWLLYRYPKPTLGVLLGLLLGSVIGLWPFQEGVLPQPGDVIKGQAITSATVDSIDKEDWPIKFFRPSSLQILGSLGLIGIGLLITLSVAAFGRSRESVELDQPDDSGAI